MAVKKKRLVDTDGPSAPMPEGSAPLVDFRNGVSWSGERFSFIAGDLVQLPEAIAKARQEAGLGEIVEFA